MMKIPTSKPRFMLCVKIKTAGDARAGQAGDFHNYLTDMNPPEWLAYATEKHFHKFGASVVVVSAFPIPENEILQRQLKELLT